MTDQRPRMRRSREDRSHTRWNSSQSTSLRADIGNVSVSRSCCSATDKTNRSSHLYQARTAVFGARGRSDFVADRSIASENRAERLAPQLHFNHLAGEFRLAHEYAAIRLSFFKICERCQIAHGRTAAVRFETSSATRNIAKFAVHHQKLKQGAVVGTAVATAMQQH